MKGKCRIIGVLTFLLISASIGWASDGAQLTMTDGKPEYKKGSLDVDALTAVIAEKQDELKNRIVKEIVLKYFENTNYASYLYVSRTLTSLLTVKNKSVMKQELLKNTADYVLVFAFTQLFLLDPAIDTLLRSVKKLHEKRLKEITSVYTLSNAANLWSIPFSVTNRFVKNFLLAAGQDTVKCDTSGYFDDVLMDMMFDVLYRTPFFKELGFFDETNPVTDKYIDYPKWNLFVQDTFGLFCDTCKRNTSLVADVEKERRKKILSNKDMQSQANTIKTLLSQYNDSVISLMNEPQIKKYLDTNIVISLQDSIKKNTDAILLSGSTGDKGDSIGLKGKTESLKQDDSLYCSNLKELRKKIDTVVTILIQIQKTVKSILQNRDEIARYWKKIVGLTNTDLATCDPLIIDKLLDFIKKDSLYAKLNISTPAMENLELLYNNKKIKDISDAGLIAVFNAVCALQRDTSFSRIPIQENIFRIKENIIVLLKQKYDLYVKSLPGFDQQNICEAKHGGIFLSSEIIPVKETSNEKPDDVQKNNEGVPVKKLDLLAQNVIYAVLNRLVCTNSTINGFKADSIAKYLEYCLLLDTLGNHAKIYERVLNMAEHAADLLQNQSARNAVNTLIAGVRRYSTVDEKEDKISIDVQSMIVDLYKRYSDRSNKTWIYFSPYFTVGINASVFYTDSTGSPIPEAQGDSLTRFSFSNVFAGEKIGIKWKIWNFKYRASFDEGDRYSYYWKTDTAKGERYDPIIGDIHMLAYASGILYNLVNVKTKKDFTAPIFGLSLGVTFFNGLDFNVGGGLAYQDKHNSMAFLSASFDVDIVEYLSRLGSKIGGK
jgi:hypothetical protein